MDANGLAFLTEGNPKPPDQDTFTFKTPVGGLVSSVQPPLIPEGACTTMTNFLARKSGVAVRKGSRAYASGMGGRVDAITNFKTLGVRKTFAFVGDKVYEANPATGAVPTPAPGPVGASVHTMPNAGPWDSQVQFTTPGGDFLICASAQGGLVRYDGTTWTNYTTEITDDSTSSPVTAADIVFVWSHRNRLFFLRKDSKKAYALPIDSFQGQVIVIAIGGVLPKSENLLAISTVSQDSGSGQADRIIFLSESGDFAVYEGNNPASINDWSLSGRYQAPRPIGRRCMVQMGNDAHILTQRGVYSISAIVKSIASEREGATVSEPINNIINTQYRRLRNDAQWGLQLVPGEGLLVVNFPTDKTIKRQLVKSLEGGWSAFQGWPATCLAEVETEDRWGTITLMGCPDGTIREAFRTGADLGERIDAEMSFHWRTQPNMLEMKAVMGRVVWNSNYEPSVRLDALHAYRWRAVPAPDVRPAVGTDLWDEGLWDEAVWGGAPEANHEWQLLEDISFAVTLKVSVSTCYPDFEPETQFVEAHMLVEKGGTVVPR